MSSCGRFVREFLGERYTRSSRRDDARLDDLIDEAEKTRVELARITGRLAAHVAELKALTRAYARQQQEGTGG